MLYAGVLFFLMLQYLRPQEFIILIRGARLVLITMIMLLPPWLATLQLKKLLRTPEDLFMFLFWIICIVSYWNHWKSQMYVPLQAVGKTLLCYLLVAHVIDTRRKLAGVVWLAMLMLLIVAFTAGLGAGGTKTHYASFIPMFDNRNDFAYAMAIMLPIAFAFVLRGDVFSKIVGAGVMLVGISQLIPSDSRGGQLASIFAVYTIFFIQAKSKLGKQIMLIAGVLVLMAAFAVSARLATVGGYKQDKSAMGRVEVWAKGLEMFREKPFIGKGYFSWRDHAKRDSHSSYMRAIGELGGIGLFIYIGLLFYALRDAYQIAMRATTRTLRVCAMGMTGVMVGHIIGSLFQTRLYHSFILVQIAVISGMRLVADREGTLSQPAPAADTPGPPPPGPWELSQGGGFMSPGLVNRKELMKIGALTFGCWLLHKAFVMHSFG